MAELRAGRSWRWFTVRLGNLPPESAFWKHWQARGEVAAGHRPGGKTPPAPTQVIDDADGFASFAARTFRVAKPPAEPVGSGA